MRVPCFTVRRLMILVAASAFATVLLTGGRRDLIDRLDSPVKVVSWKTDGLRLADGRILMPPGMSSLPDVSERLAAATRRGVEIATDGRVYGLISVDHWCGNDPIRRHIVRTDLALMLEFTGEGKTAHPRRNQDVTSGDLEASSYSHGKWSVVGYSRLRRWRIEVEGQSRVPAAVSPTITATR